MENLTRQTVHALFYLPGSMPRLKIREPRFSETLRSSRRITSSIQSGSQCNSSGSLRHKTIWNRRIRLRWRDAVRRCRLAVAVTVMPVVMTAVMPVVAMVLFAFFMAMSTAVVTMFTSLVLGLVESLVHPVADAREAPDPPHDDEAAEGCPIRDRNLEDQGNDNDDEVQHVKRVLEVVEPFGKYEETLLDEEEYKDCDGQDRHGMLKLVIRMVAEVQVTTAMDSVLTRAMQARAAPARGMRDRAVTTGAVPNGAVPTGAVPTGGTPVRGM